MLQNSILRARARQQLGKSLFDNAWILLVVTLVLYSAAVSIGSYVIVGGILVEGLFWFGISGMLLSVVRGTKPVPDIQDMVVGLPRLGELFVLALLRNLFLLLWGLIPIVGIVKMHSYAMTYYIKNDHPEYDWRMCITESRRMMDGHKWQLFCLNLSFIGWTIVGMLCLGVGIFWANAYHRLAEANFYEALLDAEG